MAAERRERTASFMYEGVPAHHSARPNDRRVAPPTRAAPATPRPQKRAPEASVRRRGPASDTTDRR